jgi:hypothetical protein
VKNCSRGSHTAELEGTYVGMNSYRPGVRRLVPADLLFAAQALSCNTLLGEEIQRDIYVI